jgi:hypothetical protein
MISRETRAKPARIVFQVGEDPVAGFSPGAPRWQIVVSEQTLSLLT